MYVRRHPLDNYTKVLSHLASIRTLKTSVDGSTVTVGELSRLRKTLTKKNDPMAFVTLEDAGGKAEVLVFPKIMEKSLEFLKADKVVQVLGRLSIEEENLTIIADELKDLPNDVIYAQALSEMQKSSQLVIFMEQLAGMECFK